MEKEYVVIDDLEVGNAFARMFRFKVIDFPAKYLINAHYKGSENDHRYQHSGIKKSLKIAEKEPESKIFLYGVERKTNLFFNSEFLRLMAKYYGNVRYVHLPFDIQRMNTIFDEPAFENKALVLLSDSKYEKDMLSHLRHDIIYREKEIIEEARKELGWIGSDKEIKEKIMSYEPKKILFQNEFLNGVFCDIEGTLLKDKKIDKNIVKILKDYEKSKPVTLWTGSDPVNFASDVGHANLEYPILDKNFFAGCEAEIVIDDMDEKEFIGQYKIKPDKYIRIG